MTDAQSSTSPSIEQMLEAMEKWGASDLFICAGKPPGVRLHGSVVPLEVPETPNQEISRFLQTALTPERLERYQAEGDLDAGYTSPSGKRFRLNLANQLGVTSIVARALPTGDLKFSDLNIPEDIAAWATRPRGLVLVTGSTGAGKSTTLAALVHHVNTNRPVHIVTVEEPIEFLHTDGRARVTQREVGTDTRSFEVALHQVLRESPDVIFIGELRSAEAMRVALQASLTGHLVLATLHTVDVVQTIQRFISSFPENQAAQVALDLSLSLVGIACQRLLPRSDGSGRVLVMERLDVSPAAARLIRDQSLHELQDFMKASEDPGVMTFDRALLDVFRANHITHEAAMAYASNPDEFALAARGMSSGTASIGKESRDRRTQGFDMKSLLNMVTQAGASDLHLSVGHPPTLRVDGQLAPQKMPALTAADLHMLLNSIMTVRQRSNYELERELDFSLAAEGRRFRVNAYHERGNVAAALRAISTEVPSAQDLGLPETVLHMGGEPHGLLLVVGPTGSGKTTTLACLIDRLNHSRPSHIITIEDPIEYVHKSDVATVHQREVHADTDSFAAALKFILRQDPDVVLIGELRDLETISAALTAAETGHLVLATLHTNDAIQTIDRVVDVFPAHQQSQARSQLAASLIGVVSQRLLSRADGAGRTAAFEVVVATPAIRTLIRENKMHQALGLMQTARGAGMVTMDQALEELATRQIIEVREATRHMLNPTTLEKRDAQRPPNA